MIDTNSEDDYMGELQIFLIFLGILKYDPTVKVKIPFCPKAEIENYHLPEPDRKMGQKNYVQVLVFA